MAVKKIAILNDALVFLSSAEIIAWSAFFYHVWLNCQAVQATFSVTAWFPVSSVRLIIKPVRPQQ
ncbi:hypothetical protein GSH13_30390 (plasmid) [Klebsiella pneumoniae]|nr:hypothetical protein GSH13_30390 [Klebsiella pneumoniae]